MGQSFASAALRVLEDAQAEGKAALHPGKPQLRLLKVLIMRGNRA